MESIGGKRFYSFKKNERRIVGEANLKVFHHDGRG
jgi:hypothetical protein